MKKRQNPTMFAWKIAAEFPFLSFIGFFGTMPVFELAEITKKAA